MRYGTQVRNNLEVQVVHCRNQPPIRKVDRDVSLRDALEAAGVLRLGVGGDQDGDY